MCACEVSQVPINNVEFRTKANDQSEQSEVRVSQQDEKSDRFEVQRQRKKKKDECNLRL